MMAAVRWAIFASGSGTNLQNVLELEAKGLMPQHQVVLVHTNRECLANERTKKFGKELFTYSSRHPDYWEQLLAALRARQVEAIFLLGYMKILPESFLNQVKLPLVNLHPSLLPKYKGKDAIRKSYDSGDREVGVSLHRVVAELDSGPLLRQSRFIREPEMSFEGFSQKIQECEHALVREFLMDADASAIRS